jgi:putative restriction endonuclease
MERQLWTREEFMLVMNLYTKIRYGQFNANNTEVKKLAGLLGKTPGAVAYKLVHFAGLDPFHKERGIKGLANPGTKAVAIYNEFQENWNEMLYESEILLAHAQNTTVEKSYFSEEELEKIETYKIADKKGLDVKRLVKTRVNQTLFRDIVTNNYSNTCAVCGINLPELVIASHILKWSENENERLNPTNGICFCSTHDRAFELGFIGINADYNISISKKLNDISDKKTLDVVFYRHEKTKLIMPDKYFPNKEFLDIHYQKRFVK